MTYKLFIDDDAGKEGMQAFRNPPIGEEGWKIAHSSSEAIEIVREYGLPEFIDFDHDLGMIDGNMDTSMIFLRWLSESEYFEGDIPGYRIHSANPSGAKNISSFMESWEKYKNL